MSSAGRLKPGTGALGFGDLNPPLSENKGKKIDLNRSNFLDILKVDAQDNRKVDVIGNRPRWKAIVLRIDGGGNSGVGADQKNTSFIGNLSSLYDSVLETLGVSANLVKVKARIDVLHAALNEPDGYGGESGPHQMYIDRHPTFYAQNPELQAPQIGEPIWVTFERPEEYKGGIFLGPCLTKTTDAPVVSGPGGSGGGGLGGRGGAGPGSGGARAAFGRGNCRPNGISGNPPAGDSIPAAETPPAPPPYADKQLEQEGGILGRFGDLVTSAGREVRALVSPDTDALAEARLAPSAYRQPAACSANAVGASAPSRGGPGSTNTGTVESEVTLQDSKRYESNRVRALTYDSLPENSPLLVSTGYGKKLHKLAALRFKAMNEAWVRENSGVRPFRITSGWRRHRWNGWDDYVERVTRRYGSLAQGQRMKAYRSAHETGLGFDLGGNGLSSDVTPSAANVPNKSERTRIANQKMARQRGTRAHRWLVANAHKYGITPYKGEPWHWEVQLSRQAWLTGEELTTHAKDTRSNPESGYDAYVVEKSAKTGKRHNAAEFAKKSFV